MSKTENQSPQQGNLGMEQHNAPSPTKTEPVSPTPSTPQPPVPSVPPAFPVQLQGTGGTVQPDINQGQQPNDNLARLRAGLQQLKR